MSGQQKKDKLSVFRLPDLIIYAAITLLVLSLFLIPLLSCNNSALKGFDVYKDGNLILSFNFDNEEDFFIDKNSERLVEISYQENKTLIKVYTDENKNDYNLVCANLLEKSVYITESTCSFKKDCVHFKPIVNGNGVIICQPHGIKILPKGERFVPVVTG